MAETGGPRDPHDVPDRSVGLCSACVHAAVQHSAKGSSFWRCRLADEEPSLLRYPPLPVVRCAGFRAADPPVR
ncbi:MAG: hypothetical protein HRU01_27440 [Myxococcales bacterium]|nr:hypothetical protein [Myxococcales bacterium]